MPLVGVKANAGAFGLGWSAALPGEELGGMVLLTPTSIAYSGTSASIGTNGSVEFTAVSSLSLNGVFSADYDNYMIVTKHLCDSTGESIAYRLRSSGTDDTGTNYTWQYLYASGTGVSGLRTASQTAGFLGSSDSGLANGDITYFYGPYLAQPTATRSTNVRSTNTAEIVDWATTHNQSTSYDGLTVVMLNSPRVITGLVSVYGLVGA